MVRLLACAVRGALVALGLVVITTCGGPSQAPPPVGVAPPLSERLASNCFGFPESPFSTSNHAEWITSLAAGDRAVDFVLPDTEGVLHSLSGFLLDKPVWLQLGSYTCPIYLAACKALGTVVADAGATSPWADRVHFVHVYVIEAHPKRPDLSPYTGTVWEQESSTLPNPTTIDMRHANARVTKPLVTGRQTMLIDDLSPGRNNPVWCTYGTCPACSFLIGRDGTIHEVLESTPNTTTGIRAALERLLR